MGDDELDPSSTRPSDAERELARAQRVAARRELLEVEHGTVRDLDAAAACECACHPRPGDPDRHRGGLCRCQWTDQERKAHLAELERLMEQHRPEQEALWREHVESVDAAAAELRIDATEESPGAPWVIVGRVDGRRFFLRERWDTYTVVLAPADDPDVDPWRASSDIPVVLVRTGHSSDLLTDGRVDYRRALEVVATVVRTYLRREVCVHPHDDADRFCRACGLPMRDEAEPVDTRLDNLTPDDEQSGWRTGGHLRDIAAAHRGWRNADDVLRGAVDRARSAGDYWGAIARALQITAHEAELRFGDDLR